MTAPILVVGHRGMVGRAWLELLHARGIKARGAGRPEIDLTDEASIERIVCGALRAVINCAAYTDVDGAEADEATATEVNGKGVGRLVARCDDLGIPLLHYSTDYVFDGQGKAPYRIEDGTNPVNAYGRSKLAGETCVLGAAGRHLVVRTSWVYAAWGKNFVRTIAKAALSRESLRVVSDQRGRPSSASHLASVSLELLERNCAGVFHVTDGGSCTWFDLASEVARTVNPDCRVDPCSSAEYARAAPRPAYSVLDIAGTEAVSGPMVPWQENLQAVLAQLEP